RFDKQSAAQRASSLKQLDTGLRVEDLQKIERIIEKTYPEWRGAKQHAFIERDMPDVPRTIEYDHVTGSVYIHLDIFGVEMLGMGGTKCVCKSIVYNQPHFVAQAVATVKKYRSDSESEDIDGELAETQSEYNNEEIEQSLISENRFLRELNGLTGIVRTYTFSPRTVRKNDNIDYAWIQKLCNQGNLRDLAELPSFLLQQKIDIAADLIEGLMHAHDRGIVIDDANTGNFLAHIDETRKASAAITDFEMAYRLFENPTQIVTKIGQLKFLKKCDKTDPTRLRVEQELAQDPKHDLPHNLPFGFYNFREDTAQLGVDLLGLFFDTDYNEKAIDSQKARHEMEDQHEKLQREGKQFSCKDQFRFVLLKLACWSQSCSLSLKEALQLLRRLSTDCLRKTNEQ
ncbi:MAG TPA: serine/threonine-protein kinase, partial [Chlamydiales bacterium]|nr:serine/threonine-protein kinase [Chlamydiales bacterium]